MEWWWLLWVWELELASTGLTHGNTMMSIMLVKQHSSVLARCKSCGRVIAAAASLLFAVGQGQRGQVFGGTRVRLVVSIACQEAAVLLFHPAEFDLDFPDMLMTT